MQSFTANRGAMKNLFIFLLLASLAGCAGIASRSDIAAAQAESPTCRSDKDCKKKWALARTFVINNASFKFQTYTEDFMETYNSTDSSTKLAARVNKEPSGDNFRLVATFWCANIFGCSSNPLDTIRSFNTYVSQ